MSDAERKELRQNYGEALFEKFMDRLSKPGVFNQKAKCWSCSKVKQPKDCGWLVCAGWCFQSHTVIQQYSYSWHVEESDEPNMLMLLSHWLT